MEADDIEKREVTDSEETDKTKDPKKELPLEGNPAEESRTVGDKTENSDESVVNGDE